MIPMQTIVYGDTLKLDFSDYIYSNYIDIEIIDLKNFHSKLNDNTLSLSPIVNKNQLSTIKVEINDNIIDVIIFSISSNYNDLLYRKNRNATILKDTGPFVLRVELAFDDVTIVTINKMRNCLKSNETYC